MSKRLSKYIASFDCFDTSLIVLSVTTSSISIALFATVIEAPAGMVSASFSLELNSIESKISKALINDEISQENFMTVINVKKISRTKIKH